MVVNKMRLSLLRNDSHNKYFTKRETERKVLKENKFFLNSLDKIIKSQQPRVDRLKYDSHHGQ